MHNICRGATRPTPTFLDQQKTSTWRIHGELCGSVTRWLLGILDKLLESMCVNLADQNAPDKKLPELFDPEEEPKTGENKHPLLKHPRYNPHINTSHKLKMYVGHVACRARGEPTQRGHFYSLLPSTPSRFLREFPRRSGGGGVGILI